MSRPRQPRLRAGSKRLSWKETANAFSTTWDNACRSVKHAVEWGLAHRDLSGIEAIGVTARNQPWADRGRERISAHSHDRSRSSVGQAHGAGGGGRLSADRPCGRRGLESRLTGAGAWRTGGGTKWWRIAAATSDGVEPASRDARCASTGSVLAGPMRHRPPSRSRQVFAADSTVAAELLEFPLERRPIPAISVAFGFLLGSQRRHELWFAPGSRMLEQGPCRVSSVVRRFHSVLKSGSPRSFAITSRRMPAASGIWHRKWTTWPASRKRPSKGGTAITPAWRSSTAACNLARLAASATTRMSVSRLNSAPPYKMHAWPPISSERTPFRRIVDRTLRIGLGVKRTSQFEVRLPQFRRLLQPLSRREHIPLRPFVADERSQFDHARSPRRIVPAIGRRRD